MKDTGVSTIFFELRIAILEIINSILSVHGSSLLCKANEKSILKFASTLSSYDGTNLIKTMMPDKSSNVNICYSLAPLLASKFRVIWKLPWGRILP